MCLQNTVSIHPISLDPGMIWFQRMKRDIERSNKISFLNFHIRMQQFERK